MGKNKRQKLSSKTGSKKQKHKLTSKNSRPTGISKPQPNSKPTPSKKHIQEQHTRPTIPFSPHDQILLIGEGDLSFSRSLIESHKCENVTATVYESREELVAKYPHVEENITVIEDGGGQVRYGVDAGKMKPCLDRKGGVGVMDRIIFNFPHVGGKSTDVNRQVRYNQELLVSFFKYALPSLSPTPGSSIITTLFEGVPYTLWNIRDLGRHSGLAVKQSFKFQAKVYPGYRHARTLGALRDKDGEVVEGAGWKGEERSSRSYVFVRKGEEGVVSKKVEVSDDDEDIQDEGGWSGCEEEEVGAEDEEVENADGDEESEDG